MENEEPPECLLYGVGYNQRGELGLGHILNPVTRPCPIVCVAVGASEPENQGTYEVCENRSSVVAASCGNNFSVVAFSGGFVTSCGENETGQLGIGLQEDRMELPTVIPDLNGVAVKAISCGHDHTLLLTTEGAIFAWGERCSGQLGIDIEEVYRPQRISALEEYRVVEIAAGASHSLAIVEGGDLFTFGSNIKGQLGIGFASYVDDEEGRAIPHRALVPEGARLKKCAGGGLHSLALTEEGVVLGWGCNSFGQAGLGDQMEFYSPSPVLVEQTTDEGESGLSLTFTAISCGFSHSAILRSDGAILCFGRAQGRVQPSTSQGMDNLTKATELKGFRFEGPGVDVKCGPDFTLVVNSREGCAYAWGTPKAGTLGIVPRDATQVAEHGEWKPGKIQQPHPRNMLQSVCVGHTARHVLFIFSHRLVWEFERILWVGLVKGDDRCLFRMLPQERPRYCALLHHIISLVR